MKISEGGLKSGTPFKSMISLAAVYMKLFTYVGNLVNTSFLIWTSGPGDNAGSIVVVPSECMNTNRYAQRPNQPVRLGFPSRPWSKGRTVLGVRKCHPSPRRVLQL